MPRQKSRGHSGSRGGGGRGSSRGGGGRGSSRGGGGRGGRGFGKGRHGLHGGAVQKAKNPNDPFKKFKHIQRNQEAEEMLRQRKQLEDKQQRYAQRKEEVQESSSEEEEDPMDQLLGMLQTTKKGSKKLAAIESSDSEMDDDNESNNEEADEEEQDSEEDIDDEDIAEEEESEDDDDDDFNINEQFEEQSKSEVLTGKKRTTEESSPKSEGMDEVDSSDEDEDEILRPEEVKRTSKSELKAPSEKDYVIYDSEDEESEAELDQELDNIDENNQSEENADMFSTHLDHDLSPSLLECVNTTHTSITHNVTWPKLGRLHIEIPNANLDKQNKPIKRLKTTLLDSDEKHASEGTAPIRLDHKTTTVIDYGLKNQIHPHVSKANSMHLASSPTSSLLTGLQAELFSVMKNYQDIYYPARTHENGEEVRLAYCMHALNHILKTRSKILHHNAKLSKLAAEKGNAPSILPDSYRDQGLFRPKVLIVVPFRESALRVVNILASLIFPEMGSKVAHYNRFQEEFGGEGLYFPKRNPKPEDYEKTFAGNSDDTFRIGISLTRKSMKLYADFYSSDILIVSPLGLRMIVGAPGEKDRDYDFLASIELMILDQADLFLAQNWDHLLHVLDHLHLQPQSARNTDFSRVRSWCLNGWARFYRQTLLFTTHELPEFRSLFNSRCANYRGRVRIANPVESGSIRHVTVQVPQVIWFCYIS